MWSRPYVGTFWKQEIRIRIWGVNIFTFCLDTQSVVQFHFKVTGSRISSFDDHANTSKISLLCCLNWETLWLQEWKKPFNDRYWIVTPTGKSNCPSWGGGTSMCISVQPGSKNNPGCPGEASSSSVLMPVLFIDLQGLLNLVGSFLLHIFHNVHRWLRRSRAGSQHFIDPAAKQTGI